MQRAICPSADIQHEPIDLRGHLVQLAPFLDSMLSISNRLGPGYNEGLTLHSTWTLKVDDVADVRFIDTLCCQSYSFTDLAKYVRDSPFQRQSWRRYT